MSERKPHTDAEVAQIEANIDLAFRFMEEAIDDPAILDKIPNGAAVVFLPADNPDLSMANFALATKLAEGGRQVQMRVVGGSVPEAERWREVDQRDFKLTHLRPRWVEGLDPNDLRIIYDHERDVLLIDLVAGRRTGTAVPFRGIYMVVDMPTPEAFGYLVPGFLAHAVRKVPRLAQLLVVADLRPLTEDELGGLDLPDAEPAEPTKRLAPEGAALLEEDLANLIA
jgi:hypothetical protein